MEEKVKNSFENLLYERGVKEKRLYEILNISPQTFWRRKTDPRSFNLKELRVVSSFLKIDFNELIEVIENDANTSSQATQITQG